MADGDRDDLSDGFDTLTGATSSAGPAGTNTLLAGGAPPKAPPPAPPPAPAKPVLPAAEAKEIADLTARAASAREQYETKVRVDRARLNEEINEAKLAVQTAKAGEAAAKKQYESKAELQKVEGQQEAAKDRLAAAEKSGDQAAIREAQEDVRTADASIDRIKSVTEAAKADLERFKAEQVEQADRVVALEKDWKDGATALRDAEAQIDKMEVQAAKIEEAAIHRAAAAEAQSSERAFRTAGLDSEADRYAAVAAKEASAAVAAQTRADASVPDPGVLRMAGISDALPPPSTAPVDLSDPNALDARAEALRAKHQEALKSDHREELMEQINDLDVAVKLAPKAIELEQQKAQAAAKQAQDAAKRAEAAEQRAAAAEQAKDPVKAREAREEAATERANAVTSSRVADAAADDVARIQTETTAQQAQRDQLQSQLKTETNDLAAAEKSIDAIEDRARLLREAASDEATADLADREAAAFRSRGDNENAGKYEELGKQFRKEAADGRVEADKQVIDENALKGAGLAPGAPSTGPLTTDLADAGGADDMLGQEAAALAVASGTAPDDAGVVGWTGAEDVAWGDQTPAPAADTTTEPTPGEADPWADAQVAAAGDQSDLDGTRSLSDAPDTGTDLGAPVEMADASALAQEPEPTPEPEPEPEPTPDPDAAGDFDAG